MSEPNFKGLGFHQKSTVQLLKEGWTIRSFVEYAMGTDIAWLHHEESDNSMPIDNRILVTLSKRGIIEGKTIMSTVQPDTETFEYTLNKNILPTATQ